MGRPSSIDQLPDDVREELLKRFPKKTLTLASLGKWLGDQGYSITKSSLGRARQKHEAAFAAIRETQAFADALRRDMGEWARDETGESLIQLLSTLVFRLQLAMAQRAEPGKQEIKEVAYLAGAIRDLATARRAQASTAAEIKRQIRAEMAERAKAAADAAAADLTSEGLSPEAVAAIRTKILGVAA